MNKASKSATPEFYDAIFGPLHTRFGQQLHGWLIGQLFDHSREQICLHLPGQLDDQLKKDLQHEHNKRVPGF